MLLAGALKQYLKQTIKQNHYKHLLLPSNWQTQTVKTMPKKATYSITESQFLHLSMSALCGSQAQFCMNEKKVF